MRIEFERDYTLTWDHDEEEYPKFLDDLKIPSSQAEDGLNRDFLNLELHPDTRDLAGFANLAYGTKTMNEKGDIGQHKEEYQIVDDLKIPSSQVEDALNPDFLNLELHPDTRDPAGFANLAYGTKTLNEKGDIGQHKPDYVQLCVGLSTKTGYRGAIFYRKKNDHRHGQLIIAHGGTKFDPGDWQADYDVANNRLTPQINSAVTFGLVFIQKLIPHIPPQHGEASGNNGIFPMQISVTGHSLGGWLAQICTFSYKYLQLNGYSFHVAKSTSISIHPHCEVFDSPGAYEIIRGLTTLKSFRILKLQSHNFGLDITNFVFTPNAVNVVNNHIGDMFILSLPNHCNMLTGSGKPKNFISLTNLSYTKDTHKMSAFLNELENNPNPRLVRVEEWVLVIFRNWDTKKNMHLNKYVNIVKLCGSLLKHLSTIKRNETAKEFEEFMKRKIPVNTSSCEGLRINVDSLSNAEKKIVELLRIIHILKTSFGENFRFPNSGMELQPLVQIVAQSPNRNTLHFPTPGDFTLLRNAGLIVNRIAKMCEKLDNFKMAKVRSCSEGYINRMQEKYISLDFLDDNSIDWKNEYRHCNKNMLKLFCLKICSLIENGKCGLSEENTLIFKYEDIDNFSDLNWVPHGINFVFVECLNSDIVMTNITDISKAFRIIYIVHDKNIANYNNLPNLKTASSSYRKILQQSVTLQGVSVTLSELLGSDPNSEQLLMQNLINDADKLIILLQNESNTKLEISAAPPPSIFNTINIYVEPEKTFTSLQQAVTVFKIQLKDFGPGIILFYEVDGIGDLAKILQNSDLANDLDFKYSILPSDEDHIRNFQQYCKNNSTSVVELVEYGMRSNAFEWKLHYNPNLYKSRKVIPPALDTIRLHELINPNSFITVSGPGAETWQEGLALNCENIPNKNWKENLSKISNNFEIFLNDENLGKIKSVQFKPKLDGNCEIVLLYINQDDCYCIPIRIFELQRQPLVDEKDIFDGSEKKRFLMCISDSPGMGKSFTMMTLCNYILANSIKNNTWNWVFFIQLKELVEFDRLESGLLEKIDPDTNRPVSYLELNTIIPFLLQNLKLDSISKVIFRAMMTKGNSNSGKIYLILDGLDELAVSNKELVLKLIKGLRVESSVNIAVSTRTRDRLNLECCLGVLSHHLLPLEENYYKSFLYNVWGGIIREGDSRLKKYSSELIRRVKDSFTSGNDGDGFLGIPLHLKMLTVAFVKQAISYCAGEINLEEAIPSKYNLQILIDEFIDAKYKIFFCNKMGFKDEKLWKAMKPKVIKEYDRELEFLAADLLEIGNEGFCNLMWEIYRVDPPGINFSQEIYRIGLVQELPGLNGPEFLHRSIAESYIANFIFHSFKELCLNERRNSYSENFKDTIFIVCKSAVFEIGRKLVRSFLNDLIKNDDGLQTKIRNAKLPLIVPEKLDDNNINYFLTSFYELIRSEHASTDLFAFLVNTFWNWRRTPDSIFIMYSISALTVYPLRSSTLKTVFIMVHSYILQKGKQKVKKFVSVNSLLNYIKTLNVTITHRGKMEWFKFCADFGQLLENEWQVLELKNSSDKFFANIGLKRTLKELHGIDEEDYQITVDFIKWLFKLVQTWGKDLADLRCRLGYVGQTNWPT